jgi:glutathione-specific gamma-glutamylcyclotransferase
MNVSAETCHVRDGFSVPQGELWVFGYGSLMWDPGFTHDHAAPALLRGYHRAFCIYSTRHRGTHEKPGLVLGLNRGGACRGMVYRVPAAAAASALDTLWDREMPSAAYTPRRVRITLAGQGAQGTQGAQSIMVLTFVANTRHERYVGDLAAEDIARLIAGGRGQRGHNAEYLINTLRHLEELGVRDAKLHQVYLRVLALQAVQG